MIDKFDLPERIVTDRLILLRRNHKYDEEMLQVLNDNRDFLRRYLFWVDKNKTLEDVIAATDMFDKEWVEHEEQALLILDKQNGELLGCIGSHAIDFFNREAELGYWLREDKTGCGYMSEAVRAVEERLFTGGMRRLVICCDKENKDSSAVAKRNGYILEAVRRGRLYTYGDFHDEEVYVKFAPNNN